MSEFVVECVGLRKEYRTRHGGVRVAVNDLDLSIPVGGVHGFLGPNGSGKTTTIRMLLGLASPTRGTMRLLGRPVPGGLPEVIGRVGAIVEAPKFSPNFTGRQNLRLLATSIGAPTTAVDVALATVGLDGRGNDRYKSYSLGMKQRLAIAATLLKSPELLILDEPTNGLDPGGIREIRDTILSLNEQGVTVLLSSHILAEVQQVCTSVTIIGTGRLLANGAVSDLLDMNVTSYRVDAADRDAAAGVLREAGMTVRPSPVGECVEVESSHPEDIVRALAAAGVQLTELTPVRQDLESVFLELTAADTLGSRENGA